MAAVASGCPFRAQKAHALFAGVDCFLLMVADQVLVAREDSVRFSPLYASCVSKVETVGGPLPSDDHLFMISGFE
jgi:hypothetical protein